MITLFWTNDMIVVEKKETAFFYKDSKERNIYK